MYDLLLKGGTVVDPATKLSGVQDVAVQGGVIARVAPSIPMAESTRTSSRDSHEAACIPIWAGSTRE